MVTSAVRAPRRSSRALVATVIPWAKASSAEASRSAASTLAITPSDWSRGVDGTLAVTSRPSTTATRSVKVPPTSTPRRAPLTPRWRLPRRCPSPSAPAAPRSARSSRARLRTVPSQQPRKPAGIETIAGFGERERAALGVGPRPDRGREDDQGQRGHEAHAHAGERAGRVEPPPVEREQQGREVGAGGHREGEAHQELDVELLAGQERQADGDRTHDAGGDTRPTLISSRSSACPRRTTLL